MKYSEACIDLVKEFEGYRDKAYRCSAGRWTLGFGHAKADVREGMTCTKAQAEAWLREDLDEAERLVNTYVKVPLTQGMTDCIVSAFFNIGMGWKGLKDGLVYLKRGGYSTFLTLLNAGRYDDSLVALGDWVYGGGKKLEGLVKRRKAEQALWRGNSG
jgi:lysozyme